jgi:mxaC protein
MSNIAFDHSWLLWLLPLAALPLLGARMAAAHYPWLELVPRDRTSLLIEWLVRSIGAVAIAATLLGLAGPHRPELSVERVGRGAQIVVLLDRSLSMDQAFNPGHSGRTAGEHILTGGAAASKERVADTFLSHFVSQRRSDLFSLIIFSTFPIPILPFTDKQELLQAAIGAGNVGHALAETDVGAALLSASAMFDQRPYTGSRVILLLSDGGAELDADTRARIRNALRLNHIALYWIYLRSFRSPGLGPPERAPPGAGSGDDAQIATAAQQGAPERSLHQFFSSLPTPYRAYEAESPQALQSAIADVGRLENLPIHYRERLPREDLATVPYALAFVASLLLLGATVLEVRKWP